MINVVIFHDKDISFLEKTVDSIGYQLFSEPMRIIIVSKKNISKKIAFYSELSVSFVANEKELFSLLNTEENDDYVMFFESGNLFNNPFALYYYRRLLELGNFDAVFAKYWMEYDNMPSRTRGDYYSPCGKMYRTKAVLEAYQAKGISFFYLNTKLLLQEKVLEQNTISYYNVRPINFSSFPKMLDSGYQGALSLYKDKKLMTEKLQKISEFISLLLLESYFEYLRTNWVSKKKALRDLAKIEIPSFGFLIPEFSREDNLDLAIKADVSFKGYLKMIKGEKHD